MSVDGFFDKLSETCVTWLKQYTSCSVIGKVISWSGGTYNFPITRKVVKTAREILFSIVTESNTFSSIATHKNEFSSHLPVLLCADGNTQDAQDNTHNRNGFPSPHFTSPLPYCLVNQWTVNVAGKTTVSLKFRCEMAPCAR